MLLQLGPCFICITCTRTQTHEIMQVTHSCKLIQAVPLTDRRPFSQHTYSGYHLYSISHLTDVWECIWKKIFMLRQQLYMCVCTCKRITLLFIPDIQTYEVGPRENVVSTDNHPNICHQDILQNEENIVFVWCYILFNYYFPQTCYLPWCSPRWSLLMQSCTVYRALWNTSEQTCKTTMS